LVTCCQNNDVISMNGVGDEGILLRRIKHQQNYGNQEFILSSHNLQNI